MIKTGFLGIDSGAITWAVLLNGSVGVIGAVAAAGLAFWLQARHGRLMSLREAVETYREHLSSIAAEWMSGRGSPELAKIREIALAGVRVASRCGRRDAALREAVGTIADGISYGLRNDDPEAFRVGAMLLRTWLTSPRQVRRRKVTVASICDEVRESNAAKLAERAEAGVRSGSRWARLSSSP